MENLASETVPCAVSDKIATKSTDGKDPDVMEVIATVFSLYLNSSRSLKQFTSFPSSLSQEFCCTVNVCTMHFAAGMQAFFQYASGNTRAEHSVICDPSTPGG